jgi:mpaB/rubber oxygenase-like protein
MADLPAFTFGDLAAAMRAAARVRRIQDQVRGTDTVTGRPYAAGDPALLLWGARSAGRFGPGHRNPGRDRGRITSQRIPALGRRVVMTCSFSPQPEM